MKVVVTGSFTVEWDVEEFIKDWADDDLSAEEVLEECIHSVENDWDHYATQPDTIVVDGYIVE